MNIQDLENLYAQLPQVSALAKELGKTSSTMIFLDGLVGSSAPMLFASLIKKCRPQVLFILQDAEEAGYFYHDLTQLLGDNDVLFFPSSYRRAIKYAQRDAASEILRTEVLARLTSGAAGYIVTYPEALAEMVVSKKSFDARQLVLEKGQVIAVGEIEKTLHEFGFREVDYVYEPGQFALRGSILDVYSYSCEFPYRIDFFGDEIDSIRTFEVEDQLSKDQRDRIEVVPQLSMTDEKVPFLSFVPDEMFLATKDYLYVRDAIDRAYQEGFSTQARTELMEGATEMQQREIEQQLQRESQLINGVQFMADANRLRRIEFGHRPSTQNSKFSTLHFDISVQPLFHKNFDLLAQTFEDYLLQGYQIYILADSQKQIQRLEDIFAEKAKVPFTGVDKTLHEGFADNELRICVFTDHQIFDRFHKYNLKSDKARSGKMALTLKEIQQFEIGDFVVHVDHGVGKFGGLIRMPQGDGYQEMIKILYQHGDSIYVSIHSLYKVSKYKSQDGGEPPRLSTLGTGQWERLKERTKNHIKDIARDLIKLYAKRRREKGFAFSHDTYLQHELEASFLYEDTPDQLKATQDVKADMEQAKPMDRLVCGDVGFGKTEVAVRAAFKAATDGKQVAVLVPTTVLAYQHFRTFSSRLKEMPVRVDYLTRARTTKQTTALLKDLANGKIDIIIGTHKLIGKSVKFKDLGLLIIDEEQKFGVSTKEKLRQLKSNVDTLTMSATPIPRTLQFSLVGARDLSVIQTPPPNRYPIQTEIHTFGSEIIVDAVNFEMSRNGQVYFVNNRISQLQEIADMIHKYIPDARIAIGHGQMKPEELEQIILDFSNYDYDVLLSTTIVENGIDIPNANTIIINGAHNFGLSDLHQMRGRVGRGNRKAFCYLLAPPLAALPADARRRLEALENFSDLGSGINIAMQDLDIRGAGNLLGSEQSGFISDLGYETYQKILNQAMTELRSEDPEFIKAEKSDAKNAQSSIFNLQWVDDCAIESDIEMYFPDLYVPSDSERMLLYRELDNLANSRRLEADLEAYRKRLKDRFGAIPPVAEELISVVPLRVQGKQLGIEKIMLKQQNMYLYFVSNNESPYYQGETFGRILDYVSRHPRRCNFREAKGKRSVIITQVTSVEDALTICREIATN
ncbi:transcription-repair coupling factor [Prevotella sp. ne3005]|uniref:transcription-repair coupling factor n=1 Tax=Prevotella sp. ne3005 TaxID=1761887 RepID=UPI000B816480|nr:transcription-repair coupling factor [Prevotella sp. ne3005]